MNDTGSAKKATASHRMGNVTKNRRNRAAAKAVRKEAVAGKVATLNSDRRITETKAAIARRAANARNNMDKAADTAPNVSKPMAKAAVGVGGQASNTSPAGKAKKE